MRRENAELRRANDILKTASAFSLRRSSTADSSDRRLHRRPQTRFGVEPICRVLSDHGMQIAPSTHYAAVKNNPVSASDLADAYLVNELACLFRANRSVYGARKCWHALRRAGHQVGRDQVGRLMRIAGIAGAARGRHHTTTTRRDGAAARRPDLIDRAWATPTRPDQWWVADFT